MYIHKQRDLYNSKRKILKDIVPLDIPFTLSIEPINYCNLKCNFCLHSLSKDEMIKQGHVFDSMNMDIYSKLIEQLKLFPSPLKVISFIGEGEPLLHKDLPYMVELLMKNNLVETVYVLTNGILLSPQLATDLINAGVGAFKISVNGLSADEYLQNCGVRIDFENLLTQLKFLYANKKNTKVFIKTMTSVLIGRNEKIFYEMFSDYCDQISVEKTLKCIPGVNYDNLDSYGLDSPSRYRSVTDKRRVCSAPFFRMAVKANGEVRVCGCRSGIQVNDDITKLYESWNGEKHRQIMLNVLKGIYEGITGACNGCFSKDGFSFKEDNLDDDADEIIERVLKL
jgi:MoaA/NifB/PqqE/SkfB family radical SAM enzyme